MMADGGILSRKMWYSIGTSIAIVGVGIMSALWPAFRPGLETIVGALIATLGIYCGSNVGAKWTLGKTMQGLNNVQQNEQIIELDDKGQSK